MSEAFDRSYRAVAYLRSRLVVLSGPNDAHLDDAALLQVGMEAARQVGMPIEGKDLQIVNLPAIRLDAPLR